MTSANLGVVHVRDLIPTQHLERWECTRGQTGEWVIWTKANGNIDADKTVGWQLGASFIYTDLGGLSAVRVLSPDPTAPAVDVKLPGETLADAINEAENLLRDIGWEWRDGLWRPRLHVSSLDYLRMIEYIANSPLADDAPGTPGSPERGRFFSLAMCGEAGELANFFKKDWRDEAAGIRYDRTKAQVSELGDIMVYAIRIARHLRVDPIKVAYDKFIEVESRPEFKARMKARERQE